MTRSEESLIVLTHQNAYYKISIHNTEQHKKCDEVETDKIEKLNSNFSCQIISKCVMYYQVIIIIQSVYLIGTFLSGSNVFLLHKTTLQICSFFLNLPFFLATLAQICHLDWLIFSIVSFHLLHDFINRLCLNRIRFFFAKKCCTV